MEDSNRKLLFINALKRMYKEKFGETLHIDYHATKGIISPNRPFTSALSRQIERPEDGEYEYLFHKFCKLYGADPEKILNARAKRGILVETAPREMLALHHFSKEMLQNQKYSLTKAAKTINKHRSMLYYYSRDDRKEAALKVI